MAGNVCSGEHTVSGLLCMAGVLSSSCSGEVEILDLKKKSTKELHFTGVYARYERETNDRVKIKCSFNEGWSAFLIQRQSPVLGLILMLIIISVLKV